MSRPNGISNRIGDLPNITAKSCLQWIVSNWHENVSCEDCKINKDYIQCCELGCAEAVLERALLEITKED